MVVERKVLLARPHAFIVAEMRPLLEHAGFIPTPLSTLSQLAESGAHGARGAVISVALSSSMPESAATVFAALRKHAPRMPVAFAGLADFDSARHTIARIVQSLAPQAVILPIEAGETRPAGLGQPDVFIYIQKDNLKTPEGLAQTERILQRHFA